MKVGSTFVRIMRLRVVPVAFISLMLIVIGGCGALERKMNVEVVVYNYSSNSVSSLRVQGQPVLGHFQRYGPGGTGGSIYCCIEVRSGDAEVQWEVGRPPGTPEPPEGWFRTASAKIPQPASGDKFLGVHIYAGDVVEFTLTPNIRREKPQGVPYD